MWNFHGKVTVTDQMSKEPYMLYSGYSKQLDNLNIAYSSYISSHAWPNMLCPKLSPKQDAECPFRNSDFHLHKDKIIQNIE